MLSRTRLPLIPLLLSLASTQGKLVIPGDEVQLRDVLLKHPGLFGQDQAPPMILRRAPATGRP